MSLKQGSLKHVSQKWIMGALITLSVTTSAWGQTIGTPVTLTARDGVKIAGLVYAAPDPKAIILLFHQAGSSKAEYATIAPRLVTAGYTALAIDQRSGGAMYGPNETATQLGGTASYDEATPDLVAALDWAETKHLPVILWGSSYSAALVFEVAAAHPGAVRAVMAFSPGEYLDGGPNAVAQAAAKVRVPIFVTSSPDEDEVSAARKILAASPAVGKMQYVPKFGVHGASTLIKTRDPKGTDAAWDHVLAFLKTLPMERR